MSNNNSTTKDRLPFARGWITMASMAFVMLMTMAEAATSLKVSMMPSNSQNPAKYGLAAKNQALTVWGRAWDSTTGNYEYKFEIEGTQGTDWTIANPAHLDWSSTTTPRFISTTVTFHTVVPRIVTLHVRDGAETGSRPAKINVLDVPTHDDEVNMAIEKALLYLYNNDITEEANSNARHTRWNSGSNSVPATASAVLAFAENGHYANNDEIADIYSEVVREGVAYLAENGHGYLISTSTSGANDGNSNGNGAYISTWPVYASGWVSMAITFAYSNPAAAIDATIQGGSHNGKSIHALVGDFMDQFLVAGSTVGGWRYSMTGGNDLDGSAQQWVALAQRIAIDRWSFPVNQTLKDRTVLGFINSQFPDGGTGYWAGRGGNWTNAGMTGGSLVGFSIGDKWADDAGGTRTADVGGHAQRALDYVEKNFYAKTTGNTTRYETFHGNGGDFYAMYGIKKGLAIHEIETLDTPLASGVDWQREVDDWLLGKTTHSRFSAGTKTPSNAYGQNTDGSWSGNVHGRDYGIAFETAHGILLLNRGVSKALPIAKIVVASDTYAVGALFNVDGSTSSHADPDNRTIVEYNWVFTIGAESVSVPGGTDNQVVTVPAALVDEVGDLTVELTVVDDLGSTDTTETIVRIVDPALENVPPIAVAIPAAQAPNYEGRPGDTITLSGVDSYEPNDVDGDNEDDGEDYIIQWCWDLNGDGEYGTDADDALTGQKDGLGNVLAGSSCGETIDVIFDEPKTLTVGLQVTSNYVEPSTGLNQSSTSVANVLLVFTENDLSVAITDVEWDSDPLSPTYNTATVTVRATLANDPDAAPEVDTRLKLFYGSEIITEQLIGFAQGSQDFVFVIEDALSEDPLNPGTLLSLDLTAVVDPDDQVNEWNENNNEDSATVAANQAPVVVWVPQGDAPDFSVDATCFADIDASAFYVSAEDPDLDPLTVSIDPAGPFGLGDHTVTVTVSDGQEPVSQQYSFTVVDTTDPEISIPADAVLECPADVSVAANGTATATDNCSVTVTFVDEVTAACGNTQTIARTWTATDGAGNAVSGTQIIEVVDTTAPTLAGVPADATVECDSVPLPAKVSATDSCDAAPSVVFSEVRADGNCPSNYTLTRTWVATDACGNQSSATQVITVQDTTAPAPIAIDLRDITNKETPITFTATSSDNCGGVVVTITNVTRHKVTKKGKIVFLDEKSGSKSGSSSKSKSGSGSKSKSLPAIVIDGSGFTINESGPEGTIITVYATAVDECGNSTDGVFTANVVKPPKSVSKSSKSKSVSEKSEKSVSKKSEKSVSEKSEKSASEKSEPKKKTSKKKK